MSELNPNHPVTQEVHDHWHKIAAVMLHKMGMHEMRITIEDLDAWQRDFPDGAIVIQANNLDFLLRLVSAQEAEKISRKAGGLPV